MIDPNTIDFEKLDGLAPALVMDAGKGLPLMLGFMNREALDKTLAEKRVTFFSRSKQRLWTKGETSGNVLELRDVKLDCDNDTLLIYAEPHGPTCHLGRYSCFDVPPNPPPDFLATLEALIQRRKKEMPEGSYTTTLFQKGVGRIAQKVGEEAVETVVAAMKDDREELLNESADLIYHLLVLLTERGLTLAEVIDVLEARHKPKR
jgi:phosphoribosyl-AMP cyclohydrolase / phosphoribosyl-ATP pyrophosphohydrolase